MMKVIRDRWIYKEKSNNGRKPIVFLWKVYYFPVIFGKKRPVRWM